MKTLLFLLLTLASGVVWAQSKNPGKISGSLTDSTTLKAVPYATVAIMDGAKMISGATSDGEGTFVLTNLPLGKYNLAVSYVGYKTRNVEVVLTNEKPELVLNKIELSAESKLLKEVTITGEKPLIEDKGDKLVYNAEKDISNAGGTAVDVLRKVPSLTVDMNGNVEMRGNGNIKVLINGKPSAMMARNLAEALRQMPANIIKSVEVITSPGAKYDAEGSAGVINIVTKKGLQGVSGSVNLTGGNMNQGIGTKLNAKKGKLGLSLSANAYQYRHIHNNDFVRTNYQDDQITSILKQSYKSENTGKGFYGEMSVDYDFDSTSRLNLALNIWGGNFPNNGFTTTHLTDPSGAAIESFKNDINFHNPYGNGQMDLGYMKTFKKPEQEFSLLGQFSRMPDNYFYNTNRYSLSDEIISREESSNYSRNKEYTVQSDYTHPIIFNGKKDTTSLFIEVGLKGILRDIGSEYRVKRALNGSENLEPDLSQSNDFDYLQKVYSGYTSLRLNNKKKWNLNIGARLERTEINGDFKTTETKLSSSYNNLIPSFTLSKGVGIHTYKINYTQRIQRPMIWFLNPWLNAADPKNIWTGNPDLKPELNHSAELGHSLSTKKGLSVNNTLYLRYIDNALEFLTTVDENGVGTTRPQNVAIRKVYGYSLNLSGKPLKDWNLNGGGDIRYVDLKSVALNRSNSGIVWNVNINSTYKLPKNFTFQFNGNYNSGWISIQDTNNGFYWYGLSLKKDFWNQKANLTLAANSPFNKGVKQTRLQDAPTFDAEYHHFFVTRSVRLTFEWQFGQMTEGGKKSKKISNDDKGGR